LSILFTRLLRVFGFQIAREMKHKKDKAAEIIIVLIQNELSIPISIMTAIIIRNDTSSSTRLAINFDTKCSILAKYSRAEVALTAIHIRTFFIYLKV